MKNGRKTVLKHGKHQRRDVNVVLMLLDLEAWLAVEVMMNEYLRTIYYYLICPSNPNPCIARLSSARLGLSVARSSGGGKACNPYARARPPLLSQPPACAWQQVAISWSIQPTHAQLINVLYVECPLFRRPAAPARRRDSIFIFFPSFNSPYRFQQVFFLKKKKKNSATRSPVQPIRLMVPGWERLSLCRSQVLAPAVSQLSPASAPNRRPLGHKLPRY